MNSVLLVYPYPHAAALEAEHKLSGADPQYAEAASALGFREPSIHYELYLEG
ncbi:MAG: hypothetical protein HY683_00125 [Chloroflexi bacterium]|nr:hypothetical protein [Chloroflexota bacterium]